MLSHAAYRRRRRPLLPSAPQDINQPSTRLPPCTSTSHPLPLASPYQVSAEMEVTAQATARKTQHEVAAAVAHAKEARHSTRPWDTTTSWDPT